MSHGSAGRSRPLALRVLTHAFLVFFVIATVYPILQILTVSLQRILAALAVGAAVVSIYLLATLASSLASVLGG